MFSGDLLCILVLRAVVFLKCTLADPDVIFVFVHHLLLFIYLFSFIFISWRLITLQYCSGFCHTLT